MILNLPPTSVVTPSNTLPVLFFHISKIFIISPSYQVRAVMCQVTRCNSHPGVMYDKLHTLFYTLFLDTTLNCSKPNGKYSYHLLQQFSQKLFTCWAGYVQ